MEASTVDIRFWTVVNLEPLEDINRNLTKLRKIAEQNECIHVWDGDDCMLCELHMEF